MSPKSSQIFYFSGTGNGIHIAKQLKNELGGTIHGMPSYKNQSRVSVSADTVGLVFPVFFMDVPAFVKDFIDKLDILPSSFLFAVIHCGQTAGAVLQLLKKQLQSRELTLNAAHLLYLPDNSIFFYTKPDKVGPMLQKGEERLSEIIASLKKREQTVLPHRSANTLLPRLSEWFFGRVLGEEKKGVDKDKCTGCGLCARVCPVDCISCENGFPVWDGSCVKCFACIHWCPTRAIRFGSLRVNDKTAYRHPQCLASDMEAQKIPHK
ncbi:MAG: EFR1 family ferrodoxin [Chitinispirillaceae bacterium]